MRMKKRQQLKEAKPRLQITSMIDVVFLLLVFFLCSPFKIPEGELDSLLPKDGGVEESSPDDKDRVPVVIWLKKARGAVPEIWVGTRYCVEARENGEPRFDRLAAYLRDWETDNGKAVVRIRSDRQIGYKYVVSTVNACTKAGLSNIGFTLPSGRTRNAFN